MNHSQSVANDSQTSASIPTVRNYSSPSAEASQGLLPFTAVFKNFGKEAVQEFGGQLAADSDVKRLLTVREVAQCLSVSTATVYALCKRHELAHLRVSNAIRVIPAELEFFLMRNRRCP